MPLRAQNTGDATAAGRFDHFIDFRARPGAMWGHTFILYGRVDGRGRPVELHRAGFYPDDGQAGLILGTFVPVRAAVRAVPDDFSETPSAIYRRTLSSAQYARLKSTVTRIRANDHGPGLTRAFICLCVGDGSPGIGERSDASSKAMSGDDAGMTCALLDPS